MINTYIFIDENNFVIDSFVFDDSVSTDKDIGIVKKTLVAHDVIRYDNGMEYSNSTKTIKYFGIPEKGYFWDGVDTFIPPKPDGNYILNIQRTGWVEVPLNNSEIGAI